MRTICKGHRNAAALGAGNGLKKRSISPHATRHALVYRAVINVGPARQRGRQHSRCTERLLLLVLLQDPSLEQGACLGQMSRV